MLKYKLLTTGRKCSIDAAEVAAVVEEATGTRVTLRGSGGNFLLDAPFDQVDRAVENERYDETLDEGVATLQKLADAAASLADNAELPLRELHALASGVRDVAGSLDVAGQNVASSVDVAADRLLAPPADMSAVGYPGAGDKKDEAAAETPAAAGKGDGAAAETPAADAEAPTGNDAGDAEDGKTAGDPPAAGADADTPPALFGAAKPKAPATPAAEATAGKTEVEEAAEEAAGEDGDDARSR